MGATRRTGVERQAVDWRVSDEPHRSPIALALSADGTLLLSANQTAGTVSLVDTERARVLDELKTGDKPAGVAMSKDGRRGVVTHWYGYDLCVLEIKDDKLAMAGRIEVGPEPRGVAHHGRRLDRLRRHRRQQRGGPRRFERPSR